MLRICAAGKFGKFRPHISFADLRYLNFILGFLPLHKNFIVIESHCLNVLDEIYMGNALKRNKNLGKIFICTVFTCSLRENGIINHLIKSWLI